VRRPLPSTVFLLLAAIAGPPAAAAEDTARLLGGGARASDCMVVTDVAGVSARPRARTVHCRDGDPACDADGTVDGRCAFRLRLCLGATEMGGCHTDVVVGAELRNADQALTALAVALAEVPMPIATASACTAMTDVAVATRGRRAGRLVLRPAATMASGHADRDRVALLCRPPAAPATFATVQRRVFNRSCASFSCHGAAAAGGLALTPDRSLASLVGVAASNPDARAAGVLRVVPGDPEVSFLLRKLTGRLGPGEGEPMPRVGERLPAATLDLVRRWIAAGAPATAGF
jgi:hypothetical protein